MTKISKLILNLACMALLPLGSASASNQAYYDSPERQQQRQQFQQALDALKQGKIKELQRLSSQLESYPLHSYLEYHALRKRLSKAKKTEVRAFLKEYQNTPLADQIRWPWLAKLAYKGRWKDYLAFYSDNSSTKYRCHWVTAHLRTGKKLPVSTVNELWNVGKSQPKICDPGFQAWKKAGHLSPELAWQRHSKAMINGRLALAKYIRKFMPKADRKLAELHVNVYRKPQLLKQRKLFRSNSAQLNGIILHGFQRYARRDPLAAYKLWESYDAQHLFAEQQRLKTLYELAKRLAQKGYNHEASQLLAQYKQIDNIALTELLIRESLAQQDWQKVQHWISKLPKQRQQKHDWRYWLARAIEEQGINQAAPALNPHAIYSELSQYRDYYGFLAADRIQSEYQLKDMPLIVEQSRVEKLKQRPAIQRAYELYRLGMYTWATREWYFVAKNLDKADSEALASLTHEWGWHMKTIQGMATAKYWDDLQMRFPLAFESELKKAAKTTKVNSTLLFAIARQESAFAHYARSPAGAMGLMQLMPSTAKQTAKKIGIKYRRSDLLKPEKNITLGSNYLNQLLQQFNGNRFLAAAAYNAGPHRVSRWLKESDNSLPFDVWIETIPYRETRGYVQNVLEYSVIYAYRMGNKKTKLMRNNELKPL